MNIEEILGGKVETIESNVSYPFGVHHPVICLSKIIMEDGREFWIEGEHDTAYIPVSGKAGMERDRIQAAYDTTYDDESEIARFRESIDDCF